MNEGVFSNLDKLLLQLVFQLEQASSAKEHVRQQIQIYTANIAQRKSEICHLKEDINKDDEMMVNLHKCSSSNKENCNVWKRAYMILNKHEEYLEKELQTCQETTEKDKKMYKDYMNQYEETFKQHQAKYLETAAAQEYYQEKKEFDEIQNKVLKLSELLKQKETEIMDLQEPGPFQSFSYWALQIASLRQSTKETLKNAAVLRQQSLELDKTAEEIEKKMNAFKQKTGGTVKGAQEASERFWNTKEKVALPLEQLQRQQWRAGGGSAAAGAEEKKDPAEHSTVSRMYFSHVENEIQKCNETSGSNNGKTIQVSSVPTLQNQAPLRLLNYQKQTNSEQWFEAEATEIVSEKEVECTRREDRNKSKDSISQTPDFGEKLPSEFRLQTSGSVSKSPAFPFLMGFTTKSPGFNFFDSPAFGAENSPCQSIESYSAGNINPASPQKDIGDLFGKVDPEDSFSFSFPSCSSGQAFQDGKDDFSFPFAFGSSQPASLKGFQSTAESRKSFSLF
ncbi:protein SIX6OS1 [Tiliqua scincoides]|uniref:protein SIX6OS1 n=1 Tax=Tiliqua scincoides TaxID=71010 RepID=UPI0034625677